MDNEKLLEYAKYKPATKQVWLGLHSQFDMDIADIEACTNYRLAPKFHGQYDIVWVFEKPLNEYHILSWKIVLDEAIRLLKRNGKLIIRMYETPFITAPMLKNFIGRNINLKTDIDYEYKKDNYYNIVFNIERLDFEIYQDKSWTFAMLTGGKKDDVVIKFLESIRNNEANKSQIIISGPKKDIYDKYEVEYLDLTKYRDNEYAEISKKKNDIAKIAIGANIAIIHDRYYLDNMFFQDFDSYGYDFDFLAVKQVSDSDKTVPFYCATYEPKYTWGQPIDCRDTNILPDTVYVNGGCMIFKTKVLNKIKFNNLIFWNQMEDVEVTQNFINYSIIPRINFMSKFITMDDKSEKFAMNYKFDIIKNCKIKLHPKRFNDVRHHIYGLNSKIYPIQIKIQKKSKFPYLSIVIKIMRSK